MLHIRQKVLATDKVGSRDADASKKIANRKSKEFNKNIYQKTTSKFTIKSFYQKISPKINFRKDLIIRTLKSKIIRTFLKKMDLKLKK